MAIWRAPWPPNLDISNELLTDLKKLTSEEGDAVAVAEAVNDDIRSKHLQELKSVSGKIEFSESWKEMDAAEFNKYTQRDTHLS